MWRPDVKCVHGNFRAMALGWCRSQRLVLRRIKSIKRKDILNMEKTNPSFEDGRKVLSDRAPLAVK